MNKNDQRLIQEILSGDREAFDSFYDSYFQRVYNYIYFQVRDHAITEDLTQEVFISITESLASFQGRSSLLCWVYSIIKNTVQNWFRKKKRDLCLLQNSEENYLENFHAESTNPLTQLEYQEFLLLCNKKFQKLTPESQDIFIKKHFHGWSIKKISNEIRKSQGAVKTDLYRTKMYLLQDA